LASGDASVAAEPAPPPASPQFSENLAVRHSASAQLASGELAKPVDQRILIYKAGLTMSVADIEGSLTAVQKLTQQVGGYMDLLTGDSITIRVPAKKFFEVIEQLKPLGQTMQKEITAQDIT